MKNHYIAGFLFMALIASCGDPPPPDDLSITKSEVVFGVLNVDRIDHVQEKTPQITPLPTNDIEIVKGWNQIAAQRATVKLLAECGNGLFIDGSASLIDSTNIITASHNLRGAAEEGEPEPCIATKPIPPEHSIFLNFANDRYKEDEINNQFLIVDQRPPHLWLLKNRLYSLSFFESGAVDKSTPYPDLLEMFLLIPGVIENDLAGHTDPADNRDISFIRAENDPKFEIYTRPERIPYGVFFDFVKLATITEALTTSDLGDEVIAVFNGRDPEKTKNGDWDIDFSPTGPGPTITDTKELIPLVSSGTLYEFNNILKEPCFPSSEYGNFCFSSSVDAQKGASGGAVIHKETTLADYFTVGVLQSTAAGFDGVEWADDPVFGDPPDITEGVPECLGHCLLTRATVIDINVLSEVPPGDPPDNGTSKYLEDIDDSQCVGSGCSRPDGEMILFSCSEAYSDTGNGSNSVTFNPRDVLDQSAWKPGYIAGLVGGPILDGGEDIDDIEGIGSLGLVCGRWADDAVEKNYKSQWNGIQVVGLFRSLDALVFTVLPKKVSDLASIITNFPLKLSNGTSTRINPMPMKMCPPSHGVIGFDVWMKDDGSYFRGIRSMVCANIYLNTARPRIFLDPTHPLSANPTTPDADEFIQFIGDPRGATPSGFTKKSFDCPSGQFMTGIEMFVESNVTTRNKSSLAGINYDCQQLPLAP